MCRAPERRRFARLLVLASFCAVLLVSSADAQLRPDPAILAAAPADVVERVRADPFTFFRFINRAWIIRVCQAFADMPDVPHVRLHGDAHVEQFALTSDAWGLDDFDDSARGPAFVDITRFLGSIDLAARQRGWSSDRDALWDRFLEGYRRGLSDPAYRPPEPEIVRHVRREGSQSRAASLAWGESQMRPLDEVRSKAVVAAMEDFEQLMRRQRPEFAPGYFAVIRAGWLNLGVGSSGLRKILIRVQGPTSDPHDDVLLEAKEAADLEGIGCLGGQSIPAAARIIEGTRQLARLRHDILAVGPRQSVPAAPDREAHLLEWWVASWDPSYREVRLTDLRSMTDLAEIAYDAGVQLGAAEPVDMSQRRQSLSSIGKLEGRLRKETSTIVEELLAAWRELAGR